MKKIIAIVMTILMCLALTGCTPDNPDPVDPPKGDVIKDDIYSNTEAELIDTAREYMIRSLKATSFMGKYDNCKHQSYLNEKENAGYSWDVYENDNVYVVRLADVIGMGAMEVWYGEYVKNDDNTYTLIKEFCDYMYDKELDQVIEMCLNEIKNRGITFTFRDYGNYYHHIYFEYEGISCCGYEWDIIKENDSYYICLYELFGLGADLQFESYAKKDSDNKWKLEVLTEGPKG